MAATINSNGAEKSLFYRRVKSIELPVLRGIEYFAGHIHYDCGKPEYYKVFGETVTEEVIYVSVVFGVQPMVLLKCLLIFFIHGKSDARSLFWKLNACGTGISWLSNAKDINYEMWHLNFLKSNKYMPEIDRKIMKKRTPNCYYQKGSFFKFPFLSDVIGYFRRRLCK